jgi:hypothetical protein
MSRRDLTPHRGVPLVGVNPNTNERMVNLTADEFGDIVRDSAAALRETKELKESVAALTVIVKSLHDHNERGKTLVAIGRWVLGFLVTGAISWTGWVYSEQRSHDVRLTRNETQMASIMTTIQRQETTSSSSVEDRSRMRGDLQAMRSSLDALRLSMGEIQTDVRELRARGARR